MTYPVPFVFILVLLAAQFRKQRTEHLAEKKKEACIRGPSITAASRAHNYTKFYIYEKQHAWLYNAKDQVLEDYVDLSRKLEDETVVLATGEFTCENGMPFRYNYTQMSSERTGYDFVDIKDFEQWEKYSERGLSNVNSMYNMAETGYNIYDITTIGTACIPYVSSIHKLIDHLYNEADQLLLCREGQGCQRTDMGVFHPFNFGRQLKKTQKSVDALAFEHDISEKHVGALFVSEGTLYYWREDEEDNPWINITLFEMFGCTSYATKYVAIAILVLVCVIFVGTAAVLTVVARKKKGLPQEETVTSRTSLTVIKTNIKGKQRTPPKDLMLKFKA